MFKNPILWGVVLFLGGMVIGAIGWDKYDSTLPARTQGSVALIILGIIMILAGLVIFNTKGRKND